MLYFRINADLQVVEVATRLPRPSQGYAAVEFAVAFDGTRGAGWLNRNDILDFAEAERLAESATLNCTAGEDIRYIATDAGSCQSPRFDVVLAPKLGDEASKGFNGDYYPCGKIVSINSNPKQWGRLILVRRGDGDKNLSRFYRQGLSGRWVEAGGTWSLVPGVIDERNPSF